MRIDVGRLKKQSGKARVLLLGDYSSPELPEAATSCRRSSKRRPEASKKCAEGSGRIAGARGGGGAGSHAAGVAYLAGFLQRRWQRGGAPASYSRSLGARIGEGREGNRRGDRGLLIGQNMAMNNGFNHS